MVVVFVAAARVPIEVRCEAQVCWKKHGRQFTRSGNKRALGPQRRRRGSSKAQLFAPPILPLPLQLPLPLPPLPHTNFPFFSKPSTPPQSSQHSLDRLAHTRLFIKTRDLDSTRTGMLSVSVLVLDRRIEFDVRAIRLLRARAVALGTRQHRAQSLSSTAGNRRRMRTVGGPRGVFAFLPPIAASRFSSVVPQGRLAGSNC